MPIQEPIRDTTALGGLALYVFVGALFLFLGHTTITIKLVIGLILCYAFIAGIRAVFFKNRPKKQKYAGWLTKLDASSFPSMHSARVTVLAIIICSFFNDQRISALLGVGVFAVIATRTLLKRHYAIDVIGGLILGVIVAWLTFWVFPLFLPLLA